MKKNILLYTAISLSLFVITILATTSLVSAECCEKLATGGWCQEAEVSFCDFDYQHHSTSCDQTSYCILGTCIDEDEGVCTPNTPKASCEELGGSWTSESREDLDQCKAACCFLGETSVFTTESKCSRLGLEMGVESVYRTEMTDELVCLESSGGSQKGACVLVNKDLERECRMKTKSSCLDFQSSPLYEEVYFNEGYLCTAEFLDTKCDPTTETICPEGKIGVYFKDSCGNMANIYDSNKVFSRAPEYWDYIYGIEESCGYEAGDGNANSASCGNCDYQHGSKCIQYERGVTETPINGDNICADLGCLYDGQRYEHGDRWCDTNNAEGVVGYHPGTEDYILTCNSREVMIEGCSVGTWRGKICINGTRIDDGKKVASCMPYISDDCLQQEEEIDCLNGEVRDCQWYVGKDILKIFGEGKTIDKDGNNAGATCLPLVPKAIDRTQEESVMFLDYAYEQHFIRYSFPLTSVDHARPDHLGNSYSDRNSRLNDGKGHCTDNCIVSDAHSGHSEWLKVREDVCKALGDSELITNYLGHDGIQESSMVYKFVKKAKDAEDEAADW